MARKKKSSGTIDELENFLNTESEIIEENSIEVEEEDSVEVEEFVETVATAVSSPNMELAMQLEGSPKHFGEQHHRDLEYLVELNIAANFGDEGFARGSEWRKKVYRS